MTEFVYKLNAPPITDILLESVAEKLFVGGDLSYHRSYNNLTKLIKPEYLSWKNYNWNFINLFYKTKGIPGWIHIDGYGGWGVNWIHGGHGRMEYWLPENVEIMPPEVDDIGGQIVKCKTSASPDKIYVMTPGAYLINAWVPHRAAGFNNRHALSLRATKDTSTWEEVVNNFTDLIL